MIEINRRFNIEYTAKIRRDLIIISVINFVTHGFLLMLSGTFWDDWLYYFHNVHTLWVQFLEAGIPSRAIIIQAVWDIPHYGYRWVVFFSFWAMSILFYFILHKIHIFDDSSCLCIALLFTVVPLNDCRVILCDVPYTLSMLCFFSGFYLLTIWFESKKKSLRLIILCFFLFSFTVNSFLFFYFLVLFYICIREYLELRQSFKPFNMIIKYIDFIILPFVFYFGKQILFPVYGLYENYNRLSLSSVVRACLMLPLGVFKQLLFVWNEFFDWISICWLQKATQIFIIGLFICTTLYRIYILIGARSKCVKKITIKLVWTKIRVKCFSKNGMGILVGIFVFSMGMFPYMVIRGADILETHGVDSRDTMLLPIGVSILSFFLLRFLLSNKKMCTVIFSFMLIMGVCAFNLNYLDYQRDWYWQQTLVEKFRQYPELADKSNLLFLSDDDNGCNTTRWYSLNANATLAFNNQKRLIMNGYEGLSKMFSDKLAIYVDDSHEYWMNDYDITNKQLDGIVTYNNDISYKKTLELKVAELFDKEKYHELIAQMGEINYCELNSVEADRLLIDYKY